jgi:predicted MFS family arabinose efflux permease
MKVLGLRPTGKDKPGMKSNIKTIDNEAARKRLNVLSIIFAFNTLAGSIVFPFLPIYLHSIRGIPMSTVGLIFPVMGLAIIIGSPFSGYLSDRFGRRIVMYTGPFLRCLSHLSLALMAATNAPFLVVTVGLFFAFFLGTFFQNSANAYVTDLIHVKDRTVAFSKIRVGMNIGWMIGPAIGAFLARTPFALLFLMTGSFCLLTAMTVYRMCPELPLDEKKSTHERIPNLSFSEIFKQDRFFLIFLSLCFLLFLSVSQFVSTLSIYATKIVSISKSQLGLLYTLNGAIVIVSLIYLNKKLQKNNIFLRIGLGAFIYVLAFLGFGASLYWIHLILCIVLMTLAEMISIPATTAATGSLAPQDRVGRYMGLYGLVQGIGWSLGPFLGSQLFEAYAGRPVTLWAMLSFFALMASVGFLWIGFKKLPY